MSLTLDADKRAKLRALQAAVRELEAPEREARKIQEAKRRRDRNAAREQRVHHQRAEPCAPGQRQTRKRDNAYLAATRREPCLVGLVEGGCSGPVDPAHLRFSDIRRGRINPGKGRKSDDCWVSPLCRHHHDQQHGHGDERAWWESKGFADIGAVAEERYAAFTAGRPTTPVLQRAAEDASQNASDTREGARASARNPTRSKVTP